MINTLLPPKEEIIDILQNHPLIKLKEKVGRVFIVGSFAKEHLGIGQTHSDSDIDVLLEIRQRKNEDALETEVRYRKKLMDHFAINNLRGRQDHLHPQWNNRRIDVYFTFDADLETRPKIEITGLNFGLQRKKP